MAGGQTFHCPNCGAELQRRFRHARLVTCAFCGSAVILDDAGLRLAGTSGVMTDMPSLLTLGRPFRHRDLRLTPVGHARFVYAHGYWDEWWAVEGDAGRWISVDEGDIALEEPREIARLPDFERLNPGAPVNLLGARFIVTERDEATCEAVAGELPEVLRPGDRFRYVHLSGPLGRLLTIEESGGGLRCTEGRWLDPFEIVAE